MALIRTFISVEFGSELKAEIGRVQQNLKKEFTDYKWVAASNFHLTLKFLGDVESRDIGKIADALGQSVQGVQPFELALGGIGAFPRITEPRVIWVGVEDGKEGMIYLQKVVDEALHSVGFPLETKKYSPHLTLARAREGSDLRSIGVQLSQVKVSHIGRERVEAVRIMKSDLRPGGPVYTCLQELQLK